MTKKFGKYSIVENGPILQLNYVRNAKDWLDYATLALLGWGAISVTFFLIFQAFTSDFSWVYPITILAFGFVGFLKTAEFLSRITEPSKGIIILDKTAHKITIRRPFFKSKKLFLTELKSLDYSLHKDWVSLPDTKHKRRYWIELNFQTTNEKVIPILNVNPSDIIDPGGSKTKANLFKVVKPLVQTLSGELGIPNIYRGVMDEEKN